MQVTRKALAAALAVAAVAAVAAVPACGLLDTASEDAGTVADAATNSDGRGLEMSSDAATTVVQACPGGPGCTCDSDAACTAFGHCLQLPDDTTKCAIPCPNGTCAGDGMRCGFLDGEGKARGWFCVPGSGHRCDPCLDSGGCVAPGLVGAACVSYGSEGWFCGTPCLGDQDCGAGYGCRQVERREGGTVLQCVKTGDGGALGVCECGARARSEALATVCHSAGAPQCKGQRACGEAGLSACSAGAPAAESCNGKDDDCDGVTDEGTCDDGKPCTKDACDVGGACKNEPAPGPCTDGNLCTKGDACDAGACKPGSAVTCDDGNLCSTDACEPAKGCVFLYSATTNCDADANPCTQGDACEGGSCVAGKPLVCEDNKPCTADACDKKTGECAAVPVVGHACSDGDPCTVGDACDDKATCAGVPDKCDDGNPCTKDSCDANAGCTATPDDAAACDDGNGCTTGDACKGGTCAAGQPKTCGGGSVCATAACNPASGSCTVAPKPNGTVCDDGDAKTSDDKCAAGSCKGTVAPTGCNSDAECADANACTDDACDSETGCTQLPNTATCDSDQDACTADTCKDKACTAGAAKVCDDKDPCTLDACDKASGQCTTKAAPDGGACDDGNACTTPDACAGGKCVGKGQPTTTSALAGESQGFADGKGALAKFDAPRAMVLGAGGTLYVADQQNDRIRTVASDGTTATLCGAVLGFADGKGTAAKFRRPQGLALDLAGGVLYVADTNNQRIRKVILADGTVTTLAGGGDEPGVGDEVQGDLADDMGTAARFNQPTGLAWDATAGVLFVADAMNSRIRKVTQDGTVTTFAGSSAGFENGVGAAAKFNTPRGLVFVETVLFVADTGNQRIRTVSPDGTVATFAGSGKKGLLDGDLLAAEFDAPWGLAVAGDGSLAVSESGNHTVRTLKAGKVALLAGTGNAGFADGAFDKAVFSQPSGIVWLDVGQWALADTANHRIRKLIDPGASCAK
jgi:DNA-binding beta-propeller fold protein YncE